MSENIIESKNADDLSSKCAAALRASGEVLGLMLQDMPEEKQKAIDALLAGGGRVGIETTIDRNAVNTIALVAIEREGSRLVLATIKAAPKQ